MKHALFSALLAAAALSSTQLSADPVDSAPPAELSLNALPIPIKVVSPTALPREYEGQTVVLKMEIDASGVPSEIEPAGMLPVQVTERLRIALRQWRFSPRYVDGHPVATRVELPLRLVDGPLKE